MKLSEISSIPKLVEVTLEDKDTIKEYGEPLVFYTYDRQPMDVFVRLANVNENNTGDLIDIIKHLIMNEDGKPILTDNNMLPIKIMMKAIAKVTEQLGK